MPCLNQLKCDIFNLMDKKEICRIMKLQGRQSEAEPSVYPKNRKYFLRQSATNLTSVLFCRVPELFTY